MTTSTNRAQNDSCTLYTHGLKYYGTFRVSGDSVCIDLSRVRAETALAFARLLASLPAEVEE